MDGPTPNRLTNVKKTDGRTWQFSMLNNYPPKTTGKVIVHIIDPQTKLAVWEFAQAHQASTYDLYIPRENASNFDMIVSECLQHKTAEFQFDDVDYAKLLKQR